MNDERRQRLLDQYEDAALRLLMDEYGEVEGERLLREFEEAEKRGEVENIPEELDQKCKQIIHRSFATKRRRDRFLLASKALGKVAVFALLLTGFCMTVVLSVEAFRIPVLNYLIKHDVRFSTLLFLGEEENKDMDPLENIDVEDCVPEDYILVYRKDDPDGASTYIFSNDNQSLITINMAPSVGMFNYDAEDAQQEPTKVNDYDAILISGEGYRVMWLNPESNYVFDVTADGLLESEFWKVVYRLAK